MSYLFATIAVFIGFSAHAQQSKFLDMLPVYKNGKIVSRGVFKDKVPSFEELRANASRFSDYDTFIQQLMVMAPVLRENHVMVHNSESLQLSSLGHPRVLLFGGGMAFGLSEHPEQTDRRVEIMQVDPKSYQVSMHEIVFNEKGVEFIEKPQSCAACHGENPKPLWNPYDFWPNAFGSAIGFVGTEQEITAYQKVFAERAQSPLMRELKLGKEITQDNENITAFTQYIHQINLGRWTVQNLGPESGIDAFAEPLMAVFSFCTVDSQQRASQAKLLEYFHPQDLPHLPKNYEVIQKDLDSSRDHFKNFLEQMQARIFPTANVKFKVDHSRLADETGPLAQMRWIFAMAGIDASNLSTSLIANDNLLSAPSNTPIDFMGSFYEARPELFKKVQILPADLNPKRKSWIRADCGSLKSLSRKKRRVPVPEKTWLPYSEVSSSRPVMSRCVKCHVEGLSPSYDPAPRMPFGQPLELARQLRAPGSKIKERILLRIREARGTRGQMPPGQPLTDSEIASLEAYLDQLQGIPH